MAAPRLARVGAVGMCPQILPTPFVVDVPSPLPLDGRRDGNRGENAMRIDEHHGNGTGAATSDQILSEIRDYCRATQTAESTFGRLAVNDGKLVSRLRDGARITTGTLDKVRSYLSEHRNAALAQ